MRVIGLEALQKTLEDAQRAMSELEGVIAELRISPADPASVAAAIEQMERTVDEKLAPYRGNAIVDALGTRSKEVFRRAIEKKVADSQA